MQRSASQASTLTLTFEDQDRYIASHWSANPFQAPAPLWTYGIPKGFRQVKIDKRGNQVTLTGEDAVINHLRDFKGPKAQASGTRTFVDFARQLCAAAGVPFIADTRAAPLNAPVSVGGTTSGSSTSTSSGADNQPEDYWAALGRIATDRGWRCFSDGTSVIYGPDYWLLAWGGGPAMTIAERSGGVEIIDGSMDTGKPVSSLTVTARASEWSADPGAWVRVSSRLGPFDGNWVCTELNRQNLASDQLEVTLSAATPVKPEPAASGGTSAATTTTTASRPADPNANRPGYVKAEDGSWVPKNYYGSSGLVRAEDGSLVPKNYYK